MDVVVLIMKTRYAITKLLMAEAYGGIVHTTIGVAKQVLVICSMTFLKSAVHLLLRSPRQRPVRLQKYVRYISCYLPSYNNINKNVINSTYLYLFYLYSIF